MTLIQKTIKYASLFLVLSLTSCNQKPSDTQLQLEANQVQLEENLSMYEAVWDKVINGRQIALINSDSFDENVTAVGTSTGDIVGLENFKNYYNNYLTGFSDAEFTIVDAFGQGDKIVKHWNFKGTHDGDFFGVPATGKRVDISGVTLVKMKAGRIAAEQDFMDLLDFYTQLGLM
ncbi:MAG: ester cyclase [Flavobacteriaceae bacterium]